VTTDKSQTTALIRLRRDASPEASIRALLTKHGGSIHGPRVETVSIPEAAFFRFLAAFAAIVKEAPDAF